MANCCDPNAPRIYNLNIGGMIIGLVGLEQAFLDVRDLNLDEKEVAEKLLEIVQRRNYIPESAEREYKNAMLAEYKKYITKFRQ